MKSFVRETASEESNSNDDEENNQQLEKTLSLFKPFVSKTKIFINMRVAKQKITIQYLQDEIDKICMSEGSNSNSTDKMIKLLECIFLYIFTCKKKKLGLNHGVIKNGFVFYDKYNETKTAIPKRQMLLMAIAIQSFVHDKKELEYRANQIIDKMVSNKEGLSEDIVSLLNNLGFWIYYIKIFDTEIIYFQNKVIVSIIL